MWMIYIYICNAWYAKVRVLLHMISGISLKHVNYLGLYSIKHQCGVF